MKSKTLLKILSVGILVVTMTACKNEQSKTVTENESKNALSLDSITAITKEAYIYGYPLVDHYRIQHDYFQDSTSAEFKAPWNQISNIARVYTPKDVAVQTPNSDTPYSFVGLDLRAEPIVLTVPEIEADRYFMIQFIDAYTFNFDYVGSRTTGNKAQKFMVVGPNWNGETPEGIDKVLKSETQFVTAFYRTQLFNPSDIDNVKKIQAQFKAEPLSSFLGTAPAPVDKIDFLKPISQEEQKSSLDFFKIMNFALQFTPANSTETALMSRFAKIGVGPGLDFDVQQLSSEEKAAMEKGIQEAWADFAGLKKKFEAGEITSGDVFGTREYLKNNYLYRMAGDVIGIFGNSKEEAMYPFYGIDSEGNPLDGTSNKYTLHFDKGQLPPVNAFWSLTMYKMPQSLLVENPIDRYLMNSPMVPNFVKDKDGGITLYIQNESPGKDKEPNWLPAPKGPFVTIMRLYWPKEEALNGTWKRPEITVVK